MNEHDGEPLRGLPAHLPRGEQLVWQGTPSWRSLARRVFHVRKIAAYFALLAAWRAGSAMQDGAATGEMLFALLVPLALGVLAIGLFVGLAVLIARTTVYSFTNRRIVLRFGVALPMCVNLPFTVIESAAVRTFADGTGDLPLRLRGSGRLGYLVLWPHARPWELAHAQPMLRSVPDAAMVARMLSRLLATQTSPVTSPAATPQLSAVA